MHRMVGFFLGTFSGNTISCTEALNAAHDDMTLTHFDRTDAGIWTIDHPNLNIGLYASSNNTFEDLRNGIISQSSVVRVWKCIFDNMVRTSGQGGWGIRSTGAGNSLRVTGHGNGTGSTVSFNNANIECLESTEVSINDNFIRDSYILITDVATNNFSIANNRFDQTEQSIIIEITDCDFGFINNVGIDDNII